MKTKLEFRYELMDKRRSLPLAEAQQKSRVIINTLIERINWDRIKRIHVYETNPSWNEVQTQPLIEYLSQNKPSIEIVIPELSAQAPIPAGDFDLVIIPLVGFDKDNHRIGIGSGWYDKFLAAHPTTATIGLAFEIQRIDEFPHDKHDVHLQTVITESNVYEAQ